MHACKFDTFCSISFPPTIVIQNIGADKTYLWYLIILHDSFKILFLLSSNTVLWIWIWGIKLIILHLEIIDVVTKILFFTKQRGRHLFSIPRLLVRKESTNSFGIVSHFRKFWWVHKFYILNTLKNIFSA